jgi:hypothetical protein
MPGKTRTLITILGEPKTLADWAKDSRCAVGYEALRNRILAGMDPLSTE